MRYGVSLKGVGAQVSGEDLCSFLRHQHHQRANDRLAQPSEAVERGRLTVKPSRSDPPARRCNWSVVIKL